MTIIVWDGQTLAADKQATNGGLKRTTTKIFRVDNHLVGISGDLDYAQAMIEWMRNGKTPETFPKHQEDDNKFVGVMVITPDRKIYKYERTTTPIDYTENAVLCLGSGRDFAYGALAMGADACRAVSIACDFDINCGMGIDKLTLE